MFTSVRIQNFRQFRDLQLDGLAQINLITGKNNTGKTSLLEALNVLIAPNSPDVLLTHARLRGMDHVASDGSHAWGFVFYDGQFDRTIVMEATNVDKSSPVLRIRAAKDLDATFLTDVGSNGAGSQHTIPTTTSVATGLEYVYESDVGEGSEPKISRIIQSGRRWHVERADLPKVHPWYFRAQRPADIGKATGDDTARPHEFEVEAQRFSQLVLMRRKLEVVEAVRVIEPRVTDLMVLDLPPPTIAADIGLRTLVPMNYLGSGFGNMLKLVLGMLLVPGGTMFIDEVEDGFHYSTLTDVWRVIVETAIKHSVQVFATTHSYECLEAAVKASEGHEGSLAFYRLDRREDGIEVVAGEDSRLRSAIRIGAEIR